MTALGVVRAAAVTATVTGTLVLLPIGPAAAEAPERTGWWNRASAGDVALPQPTTAEGDLRISQAPDGPAAYAAVLYPAAGSLSAVLTLQVRADRTVGTPDVQACLTESSDWQEGGNQPFTAAPAYDCDAGSVLGELAPDGTTLTFLLDQATQGLLGAWSLALVATPEAAPFFLDLAAPEEDAFVAAPAQDEEPLLPDEPPVDPGGSVPGAASLPGGFAALPDGGSGSAELPPLLAGGEAAPAPAAAAPAPAVASGTQLSFPPSVLARPASVTEDLGAGRRLVALLVLAAGSAAVGYAAGQQRPGPRLIGGRAHLGTPALAGAAVPGAGTDRPRGIGRFSRERDSAPRRLR